MTGLAAGGLFYAGLWPTSQVFGRTLIAGSDWREVALTFDDGPNERYTQEILESLAKHGVRASFFMLGAYARAMPELAREVLAAGHLIGNHTMTHPNLLFQSSARVRAELTDCNRALEDTLGVPVRYFRPPFGGRRPDVLRIARELGLTPVLWNATGYDWKPKTPQAIYGNLKRSIVRNRKAARGSNLLLHDGAQNGIGADRAATSAVVPLLLERLCAEGYRFVTVNAWQDGYAT